MTEIPDDARTVYDPASGTTPPLPAPSVLDPPATSPERQGADRYRLSSALLGQLERLAQTRFVIRDLTNEDFDQWREVDKQSEKLNMEPRATIAGLEAYDIIQPIAQSVYCSSAIEGEAVHKEQMDLAIIGDAHVDDDRATTIRSIYTAYIWALSRPFPLEGGDNVVLTPVFIKNVHRLMFGATRPTHAGQYKKKDNVIKRGDQALARMLPHHRVADFLDALCSRLNQQFLDSMRHGSASKFLSTGEFICDFLSVHPFDDGNGRVARLLSTYLLERAGYHFARFYALDAVILERHVQYYEALLSAQRHFYLSDEDLTPWMEYYIDSVYTQWLRAYQNIKVINGSTKKS